MEGGGWEGERMKGERGLSDFSLSDNRKGIKSKSPGLEIQKPFSPAFSGGLVVRRGRA